MLPKRSMGSLWWTQRGAYFVVMLRELSSFFIGVYLLMLICLLYKIGAGPDEYDAFVKGFLASKGMIAFHVATLAFAFLHTITWFNLSPKAMVVWRGEEKLHPFAIVAPNYVAWVGVTVGVLWIVGVISI